MRQSTKEGFEKAKGWYMQHERLLAAAALFVGFVIDTLTLQRIDLLFENLILLSHLTIIGASIAFINLYDAGKLNWQRLLYVRPWVPLLMQFSFGALFSGFLIFYTRSASLSSSWFFLLFLFVLLVGNETFRKRYEQFIFHTSIFYIALSSYLVFSVPILVNDIGLVIFLLSMGLSLGVMTALVLLLVRFARGYLGESRRKVLKSISIITLLFILLYVTRILPPIPLSLKEADVYYFAARVNDRYELRETPERWYETLLPYERVALQEGQPLYVFSAVFAPTDLNTNIVHNWQYNSGDGWSSVSRIPFSIVGGNDGGYRGFTVKRNIVPGWWRVDIETQRKQRLGRVLFHVRQTEEPLDTRTVFK